MILFRIKRTLLFFISLLTFFSSYAQRRSELTEPDSNGVRHGTVYDEEGRVHSKVEIRYGSKHGESIIFHDNGNKKTVNHWENNMQVDSSVKYYKNGNVKYRGFFYVGLEHGESKFFDDINGSYLFSLFYEYGVLDSSNIELVNLNWRKVKIFEGKNEVHLPLPIYDSIYMPGVVKTIILGGTVESKSKINVLCVSKFIDMNVFNHLDTLQSVGLDKLKLSKIIQQWSVAAGEHNIPNYVTDKADASFTKKVNNKRKEYVFKIEYPNVGVIHKLVCIRDKDYCYLLQYICPQSLAKEYDKSFISKFK